MPLMTRLTRGFTHIVTDGAGGVRRDSTPMRYNGGASGAPHGQAVQTDVTQRMAQRGTPMIFDDSANMDERRPVFVLDCDNTLLDNDAVKSAMDARLRHMLGSALTDEFWRVYEDVRARAGTVDLPATFEELRPALSSDDALERARSAVMDFPFHEFLYPETLATLSTLRLYGVPVIVSDGDSVYQPRKISRSGLAAAVDEQWVVYIHKEDHLDEIMARWPAPYYVMIDDKARILAETKRRIPDQFVTVHIFQGHYAQSGATPAPDVTLEHIGDVRSLDFARLGEFLHI